MFSKIGAFIKPLISGKDAVPTTQPERVHRVGEDTVDGRSRHDEPSPENRNRGRDAARDNPASAPPDADVMVLSVEAARAMARESGDDDAVAEMLAQLSRLEKAGVTEIELPAETSLADAIMRAVSSLRV